MPAFNRFLLVFATVCLSACSGAPNENAERNAGTPVRAALATLGPASPLIEANGLVGATEEMRLSFKTGGIIRRIPVQEGSRVRRGDLLAELELTEVNAQVEQARQATEKAERDLDRGERLHADQVISLEALQNLRTQAAVARAARDAARFNLGYSSIRAPSDGVVLRTLFEERELVPPGQPVVILGSSARGHVVRLSLADRDIVQLRLGDPARVTLDAYPGRELKGVVSEVSSAADPRTGLFPAELRLDPAADLMLASGLVAKVRIEPATARRSQLTHVPIAAVVEGDRDRANVYVVEGAVARKREIVVSFIEGEQVALTRGLKSGERVVTEGALYLQDGERIRIVTER